MSFVLSSIVEVFTNNILNSAREDDLTDELDIIANNVAVVNAKKNVIDQL